MNNSFYKPTPLTEAQLKKGFRIHFRVFLFCIPATWLIWYLTGRSHPWMLYPTVGWGIGILFHYLGVFVFRKSKNN